MMRDPRRLTWHKLRFSVVSGLSILFVAFPCHASEISDPQKVCEIYGCDKGIPITSPQPSPLPRPEEPGRPRPRPVPVRFCAYYEDANFRGERSWLQLGVAQNYVGGRWNDRISSVSCSAGCRLIAFEHRDFKGAARDFAGSTPFVGAAWNDRISSVRIRCQ